MTDNLTSVTDAAGNESSMAYDMLGRKTAMHDPDMGDWDYAYDAVGNLTHQDDAKHQRLCFYFDELNRLKGKLYWTTGSACPTEPTPFTVSYGYDAGTNGQGRRTSMADPSGSASWTYDIRGRVTSETKVIAGVGGGTFATSWQYDAADRMRAMVYPANNSGAAGETVTTTYDAAGRVRTLAGSSAYVGDTTYNALGQVMQRRLGSAGSPVLTSDYAYLPNNYRLQRIKTGTSAPFDSLQKLEYTYDAVGNVGTIVDHKVAGGAQTQAFAYDALDRLVSAAATGGSAGQGQYAETYVYTATGNLTTKAGVSYGYNDPAHKHAVTHLNGVQKY